MTPVKDAKICRIRRNLNYSIWTFETACSFKGTYTAKNSSLTLENMQHEAAKKVMKTKLYYAEFWKLLRILNNKN